MAKNKKYPLNAAQVVQGQISPPIIFEFLDPKSVAKLKEDGWVFGPLLPVGSNGRTASKSKRGQRGRKKRP